MLATPQCLDADPEVVEGRGGAPRANECSADLESVTVRCVYCKLPSDGGRSVEHVIPESLGNETIVLPRGVVCDGCNNHFARKVEAPFLNAPLVQMLRHGQMLPSKKGRVPPMGVFSPQLGDGEIRRYRNGEPPTLAFDPSEMLDRSVRMREPFVTCSAMIPPTRVETSRFLAKVAIGCVAHRLLSGGRDIDILVRDPGLDRIRDHARRGTDPDWPVSVRSIYSPDCRWQDDDCGSSQIVTEVDLFDDDEGWPHLVLAVFGTELVIGLCDPDISGFERWLANSGDPSPLYVGSYADDLHTKSNSSDTFPRSGWSISSS